MKLAEHKKLGDLVDELASQGVTESVRCGIKDVLSQEISMNDFDWRDCHAGTVLLEGGDVAHVPLSTVSGVLFAQIHGFGLGNRGWTYFLQNPNAEALLRRYLELVEPS